MKSRYQHPTPRPTWAVRNNNLLQFYKCYVIICEFMVIARFVRDRKYVTDARRSYYYIIRVSYSAIRRVIIVISDLNAIRRDVCNLKCLGFSAISCHILRTGALPVFS